MLLSKVNIVVDGLNFGEEEYMKKMLGKMGGNCS